MIKNVSKTILQDGIIIINVLTDEKWVEHQINRIPEPGGIEISFFKTEDIEFMPGQWETQTTEIFDAIWIGDGFDIFDYFYSSSQEKDTINIVLIPNKLLTGKEAENLSFETLDTIVS